MIKTQIVQLSRNFLSYLPNNRVIKQQYSLRLHEDIFLICSMHFELCSPPIAQVIFQFVFHESQKIHKDCLDMVVNPRYRPRYQLLQQAFFQFDLTMVMKMGFWHQMAKNDQKVKIHEMKEPSQHIKESINYNSPAI